jgi:hypothetical protein
MLGITVNAYFAENSPNLAHRADLSEPMLSNFGAPGDHPLQLPLEPACTIIYFVHLSVESFAPAELYARITPTWGWHSGEVIVSASAITAAIAMTKEIVPTKRQERLAPVRAVFSRSRSFNPADPDCLTK